MYAKLDRYNYELSIDEFDRLYRIAIEVESNTDIIIGDISTEVNSSGGNIYVNGHYGKLDSMRVANHDGNYYIVIELLEEDINERRNKVQ